MKNSIILFLLINCLALSCSGKKSEVSMPTAIDPVTIKNIEPWKPVWNTAKEDTTIILYKVNFDVEGSGTVSIKSLTFSLTGTTDLTDLEEVQVYHGDGSERVRDDDTYFFPTEANIVNRQKIGFKSENILLDADKKLTKGKNVLYISCRLSNQARIGNHLNAHIVKMKLSDGQEIDIPDRATNGRKIVQLNAIDRKVPKQLSHTVFGYSAYFNIYEGLDANYQYDLLHYITISGMDVNEKSGDLVRQGDAWPYIEVYNQAHKNNTKVLLCIATGLKSTNHAIFSNDEVRLKLYSNIVSTMKQFKLDGVNLNLEEFNEGDKGEPYINFVKGLQSFMREKLPGSELIVTTYGRDLEHIFQFDKLIHYCDFILPQEYNYHGSFSGPGANSPLPQVLSDLNKSFIAPSFQDKVIPMFPYFGYRWTGDGKYQDVVKYGWIAEAMANKTYRDIKYQWDTPSQTGYFTYTDQGKSYQVWVDSPESLRLKVQAMKNEGYRGIGLYAIGYDGVSADFWNVLRDELFQANK